MSGGENPDKAPAKPKVEDDCVTYYDATQDGDLMVEFYPNGNALLSVSDEEGFTDMVLHKRDRLHLARKLLEGL